MRPDPALLQIFASEQAEHVARIRAAADALRDAAPEAIAAACEEALRRAHTLKGAARATGLTSTEHLAHALEGLFARVRQGAVPPAEAVIRNVHRALDAAEDILAWALGRRGEPDIQALLAEISPAAPPARHAHEPHPAAVPETPPAPGLVRVNAAHIDDVIRASSELLAMVSAESSDEPRHHRLRRRAKALHDNATRLRMTPAQTVFGEFGALVRDIAQQEDKQVRYRAQGLEIEADRLVLQALKDPVMHLLRNAVSHGIETTPERLAAGKPPAGEIRLRIDSRGGRLHLTVEDDGRGLQRDRIVQAAVKMGLADPHQADELGFERISMFIFQPGFSTSLTIDTVAGRGMGLSVVEQAVTGLQGEVSVVPGKRHGLCIVLSVPVSISTQQVLLAAVGSYAVALPSRFVERLWRGRVKEIQYAGGREAILLDGSPVYLAKASHLLGLEESPPAGGNQSIYVAVLTSGAERTGLVFDGFLDHREAVVKDLGIPPSMAGMTSGGIALEDGRVAAVIHPPALADRLRETVSPNIAAPAAAEERPARILVVDDSITTRSLQRGILEAHGFAVRVAVDGVQALEELRAAPSDLVITDVLMPNMSGLELLQAMKADPKLARIPVIIVTSLDRREDQERGLSLGADAYIVKSKFDQRELLETVRQIL